MTGRVRVGTAGWSYPDWEGIVYPPGKPKGFHPLVRMAELFDVVEVNVSFYRKPDPRHSEKWRRLVEGRDFRFLFKMWKGFTHDHETERPTRRDVREYLEGVAPIAEAGLCEGFLVQFPFSFSATSANFDHLARFPSNFPGRALFLEVRHRSWLDHLEDVEKLGFHFVNIDQPVGRESVPPTAIAIGGRGYVRLHGRNAESWFSRAADRDAKYDYLYSRAELAGWAERIEKLRASCEVVYLVTNNHYRGQAVVNALQLQSLLGGGGEIRVPPELLSAYPELAELAAPE
ncbi:MAG: DUF72 domain-containing protein [Planctomycetes bacterium]|nr:DUF72 domain-containing protein [Planctomycetota bacterium]